MKRLAGIVKKVPVLRNKPFCLLTTLASTTALGAAGIWEVHKLAVLTPYGSVFVGGVIALGFVSQLAGSAIDSNSESERDEREKYWIQKEHEREEKERVREELEKANEPLSPIMLSFYLAVLHVREIAHEDLKEAAGFRMCVFVPDPQDPDLLIQATNYFGGKQNGKGRRISKLKGVVGKAVRSTKTGLAIADRVPIDKKTMRKYLLENREYGYSPEDVSKLTQDRRSWYAVRIGHEDTLLGILYCDSRESEFFGTIASTKLKPNNNVCKVLRAAVAGIGQILSANYNKVYSHLKSVDNAQASQTGLSIKMTTGDSK